MKTVSFELREYLEKAQGVLNANGFDIPISELTILVLENERFFVNALDARGRPFSGSRLTDFCDQIQGIVKPAG